jgi:hypothetical protein
MHIPEDDRISEIEKLDLRQELKDLLTGETDAGDLQDCFSAPLYFYSQGYPENPGDWPEFGERRLLPLWEHDENIIALSVERKPHKVVSFYTEAPEEFEVLPNVDSAVYEMMKFHWESDGTDEGVEQILAFAKSIAFPKIAELEELLQDWSEEKEEAFRKLLR